MWFIFPQITGLGSSFLSKTYEFGNFDEAKEYFSNAILRDRLLEISQAVYEINTNEITNIFSDPDDLKFKSCMTLFSLIAPEYPVFKLNLEKYYNGDMCEHTLNLFLENN